MASHLTRASKRAEGLTTRSGTRNNVATIPGNQHQQQSNIGKKKRPRDPVDHEEDPSIAKKKARIAIEIHPRPKAQPKTRSLVINANLDVAPPPQQQRAASPSPPKQEQTATQTEAPSPPTRKHTNHHDKVVNGIKHELDRLQPNSADLKDEKRKLRSQEGTRFKSELSAYFPEYDEIIGNEPKEEHILNLDTPIIILDSAKTSKHPPRKHNAPEYPLKEFSDYLFTDLHDAQRVDFSWLDKNYKEDGGEDPLSDAYFDSIHRKPERQEKAIRNTDKGRAQHEKDQVIRLLEGLQGHDWLKLMGVSGITESKKKEYEPAREYFLRGCEAIIEKFRIWKELEKQKKIEREAAMAEAEEAGEEEEEEEDEQPEEVEEQEEEEGDVSDGDPPDYSDVDASAARQLHEEAVARSAPSARHPEKKAKVELIPDAYEMVEREFKSFYNKPHLREAALGKHRRSGRTAVAWGHPVPDVTETDFDLPEEYRDEETLKIHARRKRRDRRVSKS
ncbi:something about silencing, SAS, complex subunit 4-domain-containing protein [Leptodontidium sp. 2 PMI_412]|nr:something about silencing, SAS, complex subunit 4-domain-containing protein [Leptodontidium sp. MPI-SDFR-AT-0119]KAH9220592.1 something about silencing, SAS, complex subunit 4-domain-containing protein [Leptodontidium sp. 2 PMI_412]